MEPQRDGRRNQESVLMRVILYKLRLQLERNVKVALQTKGSTLWYNISSCLRLHNFEL